MILCNIPKVGAQEIVQIKILVRLVCCLFLKDQAEACLSRTMKTKYNISKRYLILMRLEKDENDKSLFNC